MKKFVFAVAALLLFCGLAVAGGGLDGFLYNLNIQARSDMNGYAARVSAQFGVPGAQVRAVIGTVSAPADAFMVFQLGEMTHRPPEEVLHVYKANRGKGWGVIAKSLGIKPGSPEFHRLKSGDFVLAGEPGEGHGKGHGKGKGKGHNK
ncbi:MAG TPA: hypothetical protein VFG19_16190 [Geobacteraceae bacterium]|nr:hypothetical protein [Geobacteraceae bacterium]